MSKKKSKKKTNKITTHFSVVRLIIFLLLCATILGFGFGFKPQIEAKLNNTSNETYVFDENGLTAHFIDVGQGDAIALRFPDQKTMLIDAGPGSNTTKLINYLKNKFFEPNENVFDYLLLTHSDEDHCGGMSKVCEEFVINKIYRPQIYSVYPKSSSTFDETNGNSTNKNTCETKAYYNTISSFNREIDENGNSTKIVFTDLSTANSTEKIAGADYEFVFYAPIRNYVPGKYLPDGTTPVNYFSPIMVLNYNQKKIMFTGDASITSEEEVMANTTLPKVDILKVGHHGSKYSSGQAFLNQITPKIAVISVGEGNTHGHPTAEALNRLASVGADIYRTDKNGNITTNITSGAVADIFVKCDSSGNFYIRVEYIIFGAVCISFYFCFATKKQK